MLSVCTWFWRQPGGVSEYHPDHVNTWAAMVRRHLSMPHRLVCLTDHPEGIASHVECLPPPRDFEHFTSSFWNRGRPRCWRRIALFDPRIEQLLGPRFVSMDLDCVIARPLDPLFDRKEDIVLAPGTKPHRPFNGSMVLMTAGARPDVYHRFNLADARFASSAYEGSDQAWMAWALQHDEARWTKDDGIAFYGSSLWAPGPDTRIAFSAGPAKPWTLLAADAWTRLHYRLYDWGAQQHADHLPSSGASA